MSVGVSFGVTVIREFTLLDALFTHPSRFAGRCKLLVAWHVRAVVLSI